MDETVSATTVSNVAKLLDDLVEKYHRRTLSDHYRYLILDGVSVRIRLVDRVKRYMVLCAYGITDKGKRELIDFMIAPSEEEDSWKGFLMDLYRRGLKGEQLKLIVTDGNKGMAKARGFVWHRAAHQRCWVHKLRNLSNRLKASQQDCMKQAHNIYVAPNRREAVVQFRRWKQRWIKEAPAAVACLENDLVEL